MYTRLPQECNQFLSKYIHTVGTAVVQHTCSHTMCKSIFCLQRRCVVNGASSYTVISSVPHGQASALFNLFCLQDLELISESLYWWSSAIYIAHQMTFNGLKNRKRKPMVVRDQKYHPRPFNTLRADPKVTCVRHTSILYKKMVKWKLKGTYRNGRNSTSSDTIVYIALCICASLYNMNSGCVMNAATHRHHTVQPGNNLILIFIPIRLLYKLVIS